MQLNTKNFHKIGPGTLIKFGQPLSNKDLKPLFVVAALVPGIDSLMVFQHLLVVEEKVSLAVEDLADGCRIDLVIVATEPLVTVLPVYNINLISCDVITCNP